MSLTELQRKQIIQKRQAMAAPLPVATSTPEKTSAKKAKKEVIFTPEAEGVDEHF